MEGDDIGGGCVRPSTNFYPRPHMEGDCYAQGEPAGTLFLPTPSHGGRQAGGGGFAPAGGISTHALTWRATCRHRKQVEVAADFYPRPHMEGDLYHRALEPGAGHFYPRPHMEGDGTTVFYPA